MSLNLSLFACQQVANAELMHEIRLDNKQNQMCVNPSLSIHHKSSTSDGTNESFRYLLN